MVYMNSSNLIYIVVTFLKFKIQYSYALIYHFLKNYSFKFFERFLCFPLYFSPPQSLSFPSSPNSQTKPKGQRHLTRFVKILKIY